MNEIEKLYENVGVQSFKTCEFCTQKNIDCLKENTSNITCGLSKDAYPPFTAEKQLELIKWISHHDGCFEVHLNSIEFGDSGFGCCSTFEESFARAVNNFLKSATEKEKQQIKKILE